MEKNLPIKLFKKRDNDKALNNLPGSFDNQGSRFRLDGDALNQRVDYFKDYFTQLKFKIEKKSKNNNYLPTVIRLKINEYALAKTHRAAISKIFNRGKKVNIIGMIGNDELLVKIDSSDDIEDIETKIQDTEKNFVAISAIETAEEFNPVIEFEESNDEDLKVKLINYGDYKLNEISQRNFEDLCRRLKIDFQRLQYSKDLILYRIRSIKTQSLTDFHNNESVFSITKIPKISLVKSDYPEEVKIDIKLPEDGTNYYKVGVFDEGISDIEHLKPWKDGRYLAFGANEYDKSHGTFVAGIINYGDILEGNNWTGTKPFKITEAVIFPNDNYGYIDEPMLVEFMREAVKKFPEVKVWNFSIGNDISIEDNKYSDFAKYLDDLQYEHNILIVKAAGNCSNFIKAAPRGRITEASESVKTLVVGSITHSKRDHDLSPLNYPSPFSRIGPGCSEVIKPDLVHYGGNAGFLNGKLDLNGVKSFSENGKVCKAVGTSYSAPRVTALAAELAGTIKEDFNPDLIKALLIHSAKHPEEFDENFTDRVEQIGFGLPAKVSDILFNDPDEVTLILMDSVDKGSNIKIMDFPFPKCLIEDGFYYGQIKITLVTSPEVNPYHGAEYIQSDVDAAFGTYSKKIEVIEIENKKNRKRNPIDMEDAQNLLVPSKYSIRKQKAASQIFKSQRFLTSYSVGHTELFLPIKKWCIDLEELQERNKLTSLGLDRSWFLRLEASYRNNYELRVQDSKNISQEFIAVITIKDTRKKGKVYNEVTQLLTQYNFIHENVKVDERVIIK